MHMNQTSRGHTLAALPPSDPQRPQPDFLCCDSAWTNINDGNAGVWRSRKRRGCYKTGFSGIFGTLNSLSHLQKEDIDGALAAACCYCRSLWERVNAYKKSFSPRMNTNFRCHHKGTKDLNNLNNVRKLATMGNSYIVG